MSSHLVKLYSPPLAHQRQFTACVQETNTGHNDHVPCAAVFVWFVYALNKARKIGPVTKEEEFIPKDHPIMIPINILNDNFTQSED